MAAAVFCIPVAAPSAEFVERFDDGTYDTDYWMGGGAISFDSGCCILTNAAWLKLKVPAWQPPLEMRARMVGDGEVTFTVASNYWVKFSLSGSGTSWQASNDPGSRTSSRPLATTNDFQVVYDGSRVQVNAAGILMSPADAPPLPLIGKKIQFNSSTSAKLDEIYVNLVAILPPTLTISRSEDNVILRWPTVPAGFTLESTTDPASDGSWMAVSKVPAVVNGINVLTEPISVLPRYYKLAAP